MRGAQAEQGEVEPRGAAGAAGAATAAPSVSHTTATSAACRGRRRDVGAARSSGPTRATPRAPSACMSTSSSVAGVVEGRRASPARASAAGEGGVVGHVAAPRGRSRPPPAAAARRTAVHWPLTSSRAGAAAGRRVRRAEAVDERGQERGCRSRSPGVSQTKRGAARHEVGAVERAPPSAPARPGRGRASASRLTTTSPVAASRPCCSAHGLPTQPGGGSARRRPRARRGRGRRRPWRPCDPSSTTSTSATSGSPASPSRHGPMPLPPRRGRGRRREIVAPSGAPCGCSGRPAPPAARQPGEHGRGRDGLGGGEQVGGARHAPQV